MLEGLGRVVRQFGGAGIFAIVRIDVVPTNAGLVVAQSLPANSDLGVLEYLPAVTTGLRYAWGRLGRYRRPAGAHVTILEITELAVDTTEITMVYAAALALWDALKEQPEQPLTLDPDTRTIRFPV